MKMMKVHITLWLVLFAGGFLLGFIPQYLKARDLQKELETPQQTIDALKLRLDLSEIRDFASLMFLELSRQNYGLARDYSTQYYGKLKEVADTTRDENLKKSLAELASTQDSLSMKLAMTDSASLAAAQTVVLRTFELTRNLR
jgi:hypothetical protein